MYYTGEEDSLEAKYFNFLWDLCLAHFIHEQF